MAFGSHTHMGREWVARVVVATRASARLRHSRASFAGRRAGHAAEVFLPDENMIKKPAGMDDIYSLKGYSVENEKKKFIGIITGFQDNKSNYLLEVLTEKDTEPILIPLHEDLIKGIFPEKKNKLQPRKKRQKELKVSIKKHKTKSERQRRKKLPKKQEWAVRPDGQRGGTEN